MMGKTVSISAEETTLREAAAGKTVQSKVFYNQEPVNQSFDDDSVPMMLTMEEIGEKKKEGKLWIIVHNRVYDVTEYQHQHPGGILALQHLAGKDATDYFENYHREHVAKFLLPRHFIGNLKNPLPVAPHVQAFRQVRQELLRRGMFEVPSNYYYTLYAWLASLFAGSLYCTIVCSSFPAHMLGAALMGLFWQQFAGLGHDLGQ